MTNSYYKISLDIHDHGSNVSLKVKKGDTGRILYINMMDGRVPYAITEECYAVFTAKKPDGNILYNACSVIGNTVVYAFTPQTTSVVGRTECEIKLYGADDKLLTSARFILMVDDTVYNEGDRVEPRTEVSALTDLISRATTLIHTVEDKLARGLFKGDRGPQGISGIVVPTSGFFVLEVDSATGDLYCVTTSEMPHSPFVLESNGDLYYEI